MEMNGQLKCSGCLGNISFTYWMLGCVRTIVDLYVLGKRRISYTSLESNYYSFVVQLII